MAAMRLFWQSRIRESQTRFLYCAWVQKFYTKYIRPGQKKAHVRHYTTTPTLGEYGPLRNELCCKLIQASMRGDMAEVERCLPIEGSGVHLFCSHVSEYVVKAAADHGHTHIVNTLFAKWEWISSGCERFFSADLGRDEVLWVACRDDNLEMAVSMLFVGDDFMRSNQSLPLVPCPCLPIRPEVFGTAEFLRKVISAIVERLGRLGHKLNPGGRWLKMVLENAIKLHSRPHVEVLLDEMDPNQSGDIFTDHPWLMPAVFQSRCASILRCILIRYPEAAIHNADCDPAVVIKSYHWPAGARLLVEAGAKCKGGVPAEHSGIVTLSLEHRCRIAVRCSLKSPLSENVMKLPLPAKVKRHLLYQYGRVKDRYNKWVLRSDVQATDHMISDRHYSEIDWLSRLKKHIACQSPLQ